MEDAGPIIFIVSLILVIILSAVQISLHKRGKLSKWQDRILKFIIFALCVMAFVTIFMPSDSGIPKRNTGGQTASEPVYEFAPLDEMENGKKALFYYRIIQAGTEYGFGHIRGILFNYTGKDLSYVSIVFGLYTEGGVKVGDCIANTLGMDSGGSWGFDALCSQSDLADGYRLEKITRY